MRTFRRADFLDTAFRDSEENGTSATIREILFDCGRFSTDAQTTEYQRLELESAVGKIDD